MVSVLFIAGHGRSGSTLFQEVLATDPAVLALGELKHLWLKGYLQNVLCGCGTPFRECPFWQELDRRAFAGLSTEDARRLFDIRRSLYRPARVLSVLARELSDSSRPHPDAAMYRQHLGALLDAAHAMSGARVVIDASKDPLHGLVLARTPGVRLHVVHLTRDARGVAFSLQRAKIRHHVHDKRSLMRVQPPQRVAIAWAYRNALVGALRAHAASYRRVRYEDFVSRPDDVVAAIRRDVGLSPRTDPVTDQGRVALPRVHTVSGNPGRFEGRDVQLRLDDEWRTALKPADRRVVTALALPLLLRYGYLAWQPAAPGKHAAASREG